MKKKQMIENVIHGLFFMLGLITVGGVLLITVYLVISGIPAIHKIGLIPFLFGTEWAPTKANPQYGILPFILPVFMARQVRFCLGFRLDFLRLCICQK